MSVLVLSLEDEILEKLLKSNIRDVKTIEELSEKVSLKDMKKILLALKKAEKEEANRTHGHW